MNRKIPQDSQMINTIKGSKILMIVTIIKRINLVRIILTKTIKIIIVTTIFTHSKTLIGTIQIEEITTSKEIILAVECTTDNLKEELIILKIETSQIERFNTKMISEEKTTFSSVEDLISDNKDLIDISKIRAPRTIIKTAEARIKVWVGISLIQRPLIDNSTTEVLIKTTIIKDMSKSELMEI